MTKKPTPLPTYKVLADGRVAGIRRQKGDEIQLSPAAAKYENVELVSAPAPVKVAPVKDTPRKGKPAAK